MGQSKNRIKPLSTLKRDQAKDRTILKKKQSLVKKHSTNAKRGRMNAMHLVIFGLVTMAAALSHGAPMQDEVTTTPWPSTTTPWPSDDDVIEIETEIESQDEITTTPVPSDDDEIVADMVRQPRFFNIGNINIGCTVNCAKFHACRVRCLFGLRCQCTAPSGCNCDRFAWEG